MTELIEDIRKCAIAGNMLILPDEPLKNYAAMKKALISHGGKYNRNRFTFPQAAQIYVDSICGGVKDFKKDRQFYETPASLASIMVQQTVPNFSEGTTYVLEPSAGHGSLLDACKREIQFIESFEFTIIEKDSFNFDILQKKGYADLGHLIQDDFLTYDFKDSKFDYIYMNPPFTKGQDVEHITKAISLLAEGGQLVSIASKSVTFNEQKKYKAFRDLLDSLEGDIIDLDSGTFKSSGTLVNSVMIKVSK